MGQASLDCLSEVGYGTVQAYENAVTDERMTNVELFDFGDGSDRDDIVLGQAVACSYLESQTVGVLGCDGQTLQLRFVRLVAVVARVEFDLLGSKSLGGFDIGYFRCNEQACLDSRLARLGDNSLELVAVAMHIQATLGGLFFASFGYQRDHRRLHLKQDGKHFVGGGHLQVQQGIDAVLKTADVIVPYVAAVFTQMRGNAIRTCQLADLGGKNRVRVGRAACVSKRRYMVDVDVQSYGHSLSCLLYFSALLSSCALAASNSR